MPIRKRWSKLETVLDRAPCEPGLYEIGFVLWSGETEHVYTGRSEGRQGMRSRLLAHLNRTSAGSPGMAGLLQHYGYRRVRARWQVAAPLQDVKEMEAIELEDHLLRLGRLPRCNGRRERSSSLGVPELLGAAGILAALIVVFSRP